MKLVDNIPNDGTTKSHGVVLLYSNKKEQKYSKNNFRMQYLKFQIAERLPRIPYVFIII